MPTAFTTATALSEAELRSAPVRLPAPARLTRHLKLDGAKAKQGAEALGLETVGDLLEHLPRDRREARTVADLITGETATVVVEVKQIAARAVRRRGMRPLVEATVADASGSLRVTFFNQPWLVSRYPPGTRLMLHGKADGRGRFTVQGHAQTDQRPAGSSAGAFAGVPASAAVGPPASVGPDAPANTAAGVPASTAATPASDTAPATLGEKPTVGVGFSPRVEQIVPSVAHYPATDGLSSTQILALVHQHRASFGDVIDPLPVAVRMRERLADRPTALRAAHFPREPGDEEEGRRRLAFDELLLAQLALQQRRRHRRTAASAPVLDQRPELTGRWLQTGLPFPLTGDQQAALATIDADLACDRPMQRLLMGEVGSGKTVVALYAMLRAVEHDLQAALMAPTETLAEQHFATIQTLLGAEPVRAGLLTGSTPARRRADLLAKLATGELSMLVGTHALIEASVEFNRLAVVVVDEQHRFGVSQRAALDRKGRGDQSPHVLHMTATPIPRTLALSRHGDLDHTTLRELPRGRRPITTHLCSSEAERERAYARIRAELGQGRQAFVVCPLVEESESLQARAAVAEFERLRTGPFKDHELVLMHGQMRPAEKQEAMAAFASGAAEVLVATTVIEVGIDVPNATVMLVEDADRYGISQLHQLRGRIGRGQHDSLCLLFGRKDAVRLQALARESDGFALAEIDLQLRGQGELAGTRQSGEATFRFAEFPRDNELMERAHRYGRDVIDADPDLSTPEHGLLADALAALYGDEARAPIRA